MSVMNFTKRRDMSRINRNETNIFPVEAYNVCVYSDDYGAPHIHFISLHERFDIRLSFDGEFISVKDKGRRKTNKVESFMDIIAKAKV